MVDKKENILVEFDYQNIFVIDPNKTIDSEGNVKERLVNHEELVMYANLECDVLPRTKLSVGGGNEGITTISVGKINFLNPDNKKFLDNGYTNDVTFVSDKKGATSTQSTPDSLTKTQSTKIAVTDDTTSNALLGITSISIKNNSSFLSVVTVELEDVRGRALFELGDRSPYAAFFNLPYPLFHLTIKGYFGKAVKLDLMLQNFSARFNTGTGNFNVSLTFYTYKYTMIAEIPMAAINAVPHMYKSTFTTTNTTNNSNNQDTTSTTKSVILERGRQKISEMYGEYKTKGLIPDNFPEITLWELFKKFDLFIQNVESSYNKVKMSALSDLNQYDTNLDNFRKNILTIKDGENSAWKVKWIDSDNYFILKDKEKTKVFIYKKEFSDPQTQEDALSLLSKKLLEYNNNLNSNKTCGSNGQYTFVNSSLPKKPTQIVSNISVDDILYRDFKFDNIDWYETFQQQKGIKPTGDTDPRLVKFIEENRARIPTQLKAENGDLKNRIFVFRFDTFEKKLDQYRKKYVEINQLIEEDITFQLSQRLKSKEDGIGFEPTIRNILAVVFASGEAFLRLADEVHKKAWDERDNPKRKKAIFSTPESADVLKTTDGTLPVYPWPQYLVVNPPSKDNPESYQIKYPGDPDQIDITGGNDYLAWPEVEFVEEFIFGLTQRDKPTESPNNINNELTQPQRVSVNALEFPISNIVYQNQEQSKFFYEIWERLFISSFYNGLNKTDSKTKQISEIIAEVETDNIVKSLGGFSPYITKILKNYGINEANFEVFLKHISNDGTGNNWQNFIRYNYVTPYLKNYVTNSFGIYDSSILLSDVTQSTGGMLNQDRLKDYLSKGPVNNFGFMDTYPFTNNSWVKNNLSNGQSLGSEDTYNKTSNVITYNSSNNVIANYGDTTLQDNVRPVTYFNYLSGYDPVTIPTFSLSTLGGIDYFYTNRTKKEQVPTEGTINFERTSTTSIATLTQTTSMMNTPMFINSIQTGVRNFQASNPYPFVSSAYLLLNSLPLATLREKYKSFENGEPKNLDYIFATLKKFGAIHKLPYAWILKYGSIWHRYKKWKETGVDIINNDWSNFNYISNYDPITNSPTTQYNLDYANLDGTLSAATIILEQNVVVSPPLFNSVINTGFYPGLINDYNLFYQGFYLFTGYTNSEIQSTINTSFSGFSLIPGPTIRKPRGFDLSQTGRTLFLKTWTSFVTESANTSNVFILPSFGSNENQTYEECFEFNTNGTLKKEVIGNNSMYNGSVRLFWSAPQFGYFNLSEITKPTPEEYLKQVYIGGVDEQDNFTLASSYTDISEMFGTFKKEILDLFEDKFLSFSKSIYDYDPTKDGEYPYGNFQSLMRNLLKIQKPTGVSFEGLINDAQTKQFNNIISELGSFMNFDIAFKYGNPTDFDRQKFYSFSTTPIVTVQDPYSYLSYAGNTPSALPPSTTLSVSKTNYPTVWNALELYVGFSTIFELVYKDSGSYITDFFIDMDVEFSEQNVINLSSLIKIYATQKLKDPTLNKTKFIKLLDEHLNSNYDFQLTTTQSLFTKLRASLPDVNETSQRRSSSVDSQQSKVELWESFKALNDKWISGYDFTNKTLFEDVLFLDRASRDIGGQIYCDIFKLKQTLFSSGQESKINMLRYVESIITDNNFIILTMPSYVNFYNVQDAIKNPVPKIEGSLEFANTLFGTHVNLDTKDSSSKMVCLYGGKPSEHLAMDENKDIKYKNDSFSLTRAGNPLVESQIGKTDWALSNRVVGFNVDVGIRNQNIFYNLQVDQNAGKATAESLQILTDISNQAGNRNSSTQNTSLYNLYKTRSYTCTVSCLGNVMIQPTMYFNLRHVPMFYGPYMITDVSHSIQPGRFETIFNGVRQSISALPKIDNYLTSLNTNLLKNIKEKMKNDSQNKINYNENLKQQGELVEKSNKGTPKADDSKSCQAGITAGTYSQYAFITATATTTTFKNIVDEINNQTTIKEVKLMVFITMYMASSSVNTETLESFNYNYGMAPLDAVNWGDRKKFFAPENSFICLTKTNLQSRAYATFGSLKSHIEFLVSTWNLIAITGQLSQINVNTITKTFVNFYPKIDNIYDSMVENNSISSVSEKISKGYNKAKELGLVD
jgi:hypothetical protein